MTLRTKNGSYSIYALTVSPRTGTQTLGTLKKHMQEYVTKFKNTIKNYSYALENGKKGDHPHIHTLIEYKKAYRPDNRRRHFKNWWVKALVTIETKNLLVSKPAHAPRYYFDQYMRKEGIEFFNKGFDSAKLKQHQLKEKSKIYRLGSTRFPVHKNNFLEVYRVVSQNDDFENVCNTDYNYHINYLLRYLETHNYQYSYIFAHKKQVWDMIFYLQNREIDFAPSS